MIELLFAAPAAAPQTPTLQDLFPPAVSITAQNYMDIPVQLPPQQPPIPQGKKSRNCLRKGVQHREIGRQISPQHHALSAMPNRAFQRSAPDPNAPLAMPQQYYDNYPQTDDEAVIHAYENEWQLRIGNEPIPALEDITVQIPSTDQSALSCDFVLPA